MEAVKEKSKNVLDRALQDIVSPIVECVDVDGVVRRIDVNDVVQRIDVNELVQKIDVNALLQRVDINALLDRSDLAAIVAQSSSGVFSGIMDNLRFQIVRVDLFLLQLFQCWRPSNSGSSRRAVLPPPPGVNVDTNRDDDNAFVPRSTTQKAVAVQLRYCGFFSKTIAFATDMGIIFVIEAIVSLAVEAALRRINTLFRHHFSSSSSRDTDEQEEFLFLSALNFLFAFGYFWITVALTDQTIGMAVVGVRVVNADGDRDVSLHRAFLRTVALVGTVLVWPLAILVGLYRRDGRMAHDLVAHTGIIFKWNARMARLREGPIHDIDDDGGGCADADGEYSNATSSLHASQRASDDGIDSEHGNAQRSVTLSHYENRSSLLNGNGKKTVKDVKAVKDNFNEATAPTKGAHEHGNALAATKERSFSSPPPSSVADESILSKVNGSSVESSTAATQTCGVAKNNANDARTMVLAPGVNCEDGSALKTRAAPSASKTRIVLHEGRQDLHNIKPKGVIGFFFNPVRNILLEPTLAIATAVVPPVVGALPFGDEVAAASLHLPMQFARAGYGLLSGRQEEGKANLALVAKNNIVCTSGAGSKAIPRLTASDSLQSLILLARSLGIRVDDGLDETVARDLYDGRLMDDMKIFHKIQQECDDRVKAKKFEQSEIQDEIHAGSLMMKFATAAYGTGLLECTLDECTEAKELERVKRDVSKYVDIDEDDVKLICVSEGESTMKVLRHFVAIDRNTTSVVLSVCGNLSVSGNVVDIQANDVQFCTGLAHRGATEMANNLWEVSGHVIEKIFSRLDADEDGQHWGFVITGHALGAAVGALLNIKCHVENLLGQRQVKFFGFASPPVFNLDENDRDPTTARAINQAIENSTCYINGDDCVPFLSEVSVSLLSARIKTVDDSCKRLWHQDRAAFASGRMPIPQVLIHLVARTDQPDVPGSTRLKIPARKVVWTLKDQDTEQFSAIGCLPDDLAKLDIYVSDKMVSDLMPNVYAESLDALAMSLQTTGRL